jgi:hypothetical protein
MRITIPRKLVIVFGLFDLFFVYLVFASLLGRFTIILPLGGLDPLFTTVGLAICNTVIALQVWSKRKTNH